MACVHNQVKIDDLNDIIKVKYQQIDGLKDNINKCGEIKEKHEKFNEKIDCVITNLTDNYVIQGQSYDNGKMTECLTNSKNTISDCDEIINLSNEKIISLECEIDSLRNQIVSLDCDCSSCHVLVVSLIEE